MDQSGLRRELMAVLVEVTDETASKTARLILADPANYSSYHGLPLEEVERRMHSSIDAIAASVEGNSMRPVTKFLDTIYPKLLRAGYDPVVLMRVGDLINQQLVEAVRQARPNNPALLEYAIRTFGFMLNNLNKMRLYNLSLNLREEELHLPPSS